MLITCQADLASALVLPKTTSQTLSLPLEAASISRPSCVENSAAADSWGVSIHTAIFAGICQHALGHSISLIATSAASVSNGTVLDWQGQELQILVAPRHARLGLRMLVTATSL